MKHCFLCRWSFGAIEYGDDADIKITPVLKCHPNGDIQKEKKAVKVCVHYNAEEADDQLERSEDEQ